MGSVNVASCGQPAGNSTFSRRDFPGDQESQETANPRPDGDRLRGDGVAIHHPGRNPASGGPPGLGKNWGSRRAAHRRYCGLVAHAFCHTCRHGSVRTAKPKGLASVGAVAPQRHQYPTGRIVAKPDKWPSSSDPPKTALEGIDPALSPCGG